MRSLAEEIKDRYIVRAIVLEALLRKLIDGAKRCEGEGGFALWAEIEGYEWLTEVEKALK